jgi:hypothetical protein
MASAPSAQNPVPSVLTSSTRRAAMQRSSESIGLHRRCVGQRAGGIDQSAEIFGSNHSAGSPWRGRTVVPLCLALNDTAFAQHALLRTMRAMTTWFCDAYASWQKGGVENANGRPRRWLPRQTDIDKVSDEEIQDIVIAANLTPENACASRPLFRQSSKSLAKTCKSALHSPVALGSKIQAMPA